MPENDTYIKMKGTVAVPGVYEKDGVRYVKTAEELKDAAYRYPILPITLGHVPMNEPVPPSLQIGTVSQKWSEEQQKVLGEFWFDKHKVPETLRLRAYEGAGIPISAQFMADEKDDEDTIHGIAYHHVAALDGENPVCPLDSCGAFVVAESKTSDRLSFHERVDDLHYKEAEAPPEPTPEPDEAPVEVVPEAPKTEAPDEQKPEETVEPTQEEPEVRLEPETPIPVQAPPQTHKGFEMVDGKYRFVLPVFQNKEEEQ